MSSVRGLFSRWSLFYFVSRFKTWLAREREKEKKKKNGIDLFCAFCLSISMCVCVGFCFFRRYNDRHRKIDDSRTLNEWKRCLCQATKTTKKEKKTQHVDWRIYTRTEARDACEELWKEVFLYWSTLFSSRFNYLIDD